MIDFTGERVVPGQVDVDLWNEHVSRYAFAAQFAGGKRALDIGCGAGYGAAELSRTAAFVFGLDISSDAALYAHQRFPIPNLQFTAASACAIPYPSGAFDLVTAFELIEHLSDWPQLLSEARRVLAPNGLFIVSTPNKAYYTASRGPEGANPFHVHEFEAAEFRAELERCFPHVQMLLQNRSEAFVFYPSKTYAPVSARIDSSGGFENQAHFFVALCSTQPFAWIPSFVYVPRAANVLAEREQHIEKLEADLRSTQASLAGLHAAHERQHAHLEDQNRWAIALEADLKATGHRVVELQDAYAAEQKAALETVRLYDEKVQELEEANAGKTRWALEIERRLTAEIEHLRTQLVETIRLKETAEATVDERTRWALDLQRQLDHAEAQLAGVTASRWVRAGRLFGVGPEL